MLRPCALLILLLAALLLPSAGCSSPEPDLAEFQTIPRETFIQAYVELRAAALRSSRYQIGVAQRDSILEGLGITEQDLITFAETRGGDLEYLKELWAEVDSVMRSRRSGPQGRAGSGGPG